jgi:transcriptional regulator with XRE-family HTH domain
MFSERLQSLRKEHGISQEELSEVLDVSRQSISKYENGTAQPSFEKLIVLSKYFNVTIDDLLGNTKWRPAEKTLVIKNADSNRILIKSKIDGKVSSFYKFIVSPIFGKKEYHPEVLMMGVDGHSFWGDSAVSLAWYATKEDYEKEVNEIMKAIALGETSYDLKYYVDIKKKGLFDFEMVK